MPWQISDVGRHNKKAAESKEKAKLWVKVANGALKSCLAKGGSQDKCESSAIRQANSVVAKNLEGDINMEKFALKITDHIKFEDIEQTETDEGLLLKGIPIFHTGKHRDKVYKEENLENYIKNFDPEEDIPIQADHSDSVWETLGYIKKVYRQGQRLLADLMLSDENAITRWKKKLMKKWSLAIEIVNDKIHHLAAVAFPQVKEAAVHARGEGQGQGGSKQGDGGADVCKCPECGATAKHEKGTPCNEMNCPKCGASMVGENMDSYEDLVNEFRWISTAEENEMPDSHFLWLRHEKTGNKSKDRKLPYKDKQGNINRSGIKGAYNALKGARGGVDLSGGTSSSETMNKLIKAIRSYNRKHPDDKYIPSDLKEKLSGINAELLDILEEKQLKEVKEEMAENKEAKELLKEAAENEEKLSKERDGLKEKVEKLNEQIQEKDKVLSEAQAKLKEADVDKRIAELKESGKIVPAQEEKVKIHMMELEAEKLDAFTEILKSSEAKVNLDEKGQQKNDKETKDGKKTMDDYSDEELVKEAEKIAKKENIEFDEAYDNLVEKLSE